MQGVGGVRQKLFLRFINFIQMPKDESIQSVLIIGSGPIVIGQACEFDYSGSQASKSLQEEGIEVTLINSNPATIMTDPVTADHVSHTPPNHPSRPAYRRGGSPAEGQNPVLFPCPAKRR